MKLSSILSTTLVSMGLMAPAVMANGWQPLTNQPPGIASTLFLLMDGRVLMNEYFSRHWWILTPDASGSYLNGTWSAAADSKYDRLYYGSGVLKDGRVIVAGGEYSNNGGSDKAEIYDPVTDKWSNPGIPSGWGYIGDAPSAVLTDGRFFLSNYFSPQTAIFDPVAGSWTAAASALSPSNVEETWTLLPDGTVLTEDCDGHPNTELYDPVLDVWVNLGPTPTDLVNGGLEIGPGLMLYTGACFVIGATPHSARYTPSGTPGGVGTWVGGGQPPIIGGSRVVANDAPAAILPNGHVLCALAHDWTPPIYSCEYTGKKFVRVPDAGNNGGTPYDGRMLPLPTGEVLYANVTIELYTCDGGPDPSWRPTITSLATDFIPGESYVLAGTQLNGLTTGNSYGDECGVATNYPVVRLHYTNTNHVTYCRTHDADTMSIAPGGAVTTQLEIPAGAETGPATLEVVANGIPSDPVNVVVRDPITIDFDSLAAGVVVNTQFFEATFSSSTGFDNWTVALNAGSSQPNVIATGPSGGPIDGLSDTYVDFVCPVASLTIRAVGVDNVGPVANVNVFESGALAATVPVEGVGDPTTPIRVDLTSFHNVTRIELVAITDLGGISWDDFRFCLASSASWNNYGSGYAGTLGIPALTAATNPILGNPFSIDLGNSLGSTTTALLIVGSQQASIPTPKGGEILVLPALWVPLQLPPTGIQLTSTFPNDPQLCGFTAFLQAIEIDAGATFGFAFTQGMELVLGY